MNDARHFDTAGAENPDSSLDAQTLFQLKRMLLFTNEDEQYLMMAGNILAAHTEDILDRWYEYILKNNYLAGYFARDGKPDLAYLQSLRPEFRQWINNLCTREEGTRWWLFEEHIAAELGQTNHSQPGSLPVIFLRYLTTFIYPVSEAVRTFLDGHGYPESDVERMQQAWFKAISFSVLLWIYPQSRSPLF